MWQIKVIFKKINNSLGTTKKWFSFFEKKTCNCHWVKIKYDFWMVKDFQACFVFSFHTFVITAIVEYFFWERISNSIIYLFCKILCAPLMKLFPHCKNMQQKYLIQSFQIKERREQFRKLSNENVTPAAFTTTAMYY